MIRSFIDGGTEHIFHGIDSKAARRISRELWPRIRRVLDQLAVAQEVGDMRVPPSNRLEKLSGDLRGRYSVRVNQQFRITFRFSDGDAWEVKCEDYH